MRKVGAGGEVDVLFECEGERAPFDEAVFEPAVVDDGDGPGEGFRGLCAVFAVVSEGEGFGVSE